MVDFKNWILDANPKYRFHAKISMVLFRSLDFRNLIL
jgi:hypothetical protein